MLSVTEICAYLIIIITIIIVIFVARLIAVELRTHSNVGSKRECCPLASNVE